MRICEENIAGLSAEELIELVASDLYRPENADLLQSEDFDRLPDYVRQLIFILDFETIYEMEGILTYLQNSSGQYLYQTTESFQQTDNLEIAQCLKDIKAAIKNHGIELTDLRKSLVDVKVCDLVPTGEAAGNEELTQQILAIDARLSPLVEEKEFWQNVERKIREKR